MHMAEPKIKPDQSEPLNILIADDHELLRLGLRRILRQRKNIKVVAEAENGAQAIDLIKKHSPDLAIVDISMPDIDGIKVTRHLRNLHCKTRILILSVHDAYSYASQAIKAGASGYLQKDESSELLIEAIDRIMNGGIYVSETARQNLMSFVAHARSDDDISVIDKLSDRERQIYLLVGAGYSSRDIAQELGLSIKTVDAHKQRIKAKLNLNGCLALTKNAVTFANRGNNPPPEA